MKTGLSEKELLERLKRFRALTTLKERLEFWQFHLPLNYVEYHELPTGDERYDECKEFDPVIKQEEQQEFAGWLIKNYHKLSNRKDRNKILLDFGELRDGFESELEKMENKLDFVTDKLWEINEEFKQKLANNGWGIAQSISGGIHPPEYSYKYNASFASFAKYKELGAAPNYKEVYPSFSKILQIENGYTVGKFWEYLNTLKAKEQTQEQESDKKQIRQRKKITEPQQILIAYYAGFFDNLSGLDLNVKDRAELVANVLQTGAENTEKYMRAIGTDNSSTYTETNYKFLVDYFEQKGLVEIRERCRAVLHKIQKAKGK